MSSRQFLSLPGYKAPQLKESWNINKEISELGLTLQRDWQSNVVTERIILSGGREPLTKTIITIPPSQPVPQNSWTTVDIDIDQPSVQPTVEVENISSDWKIF